MSWSSAVSTSLWFAPSPLQRRDWKIGMIGAGNIARRAHLPAYRKLGIGIAAVADVSEPARAAVQHDWDVPHVYADYREMLAHERLDAVDITVHERWSDVKLDAVRAAAEAGVHILIQKPLALDEATCIAMVEAARRSNVQMAVNQNARWAPAFRAGKLLLEAGCVGAPRMMTLTARRPPRSGDVLHNFSVHSVDLVRYYIGREPVRLFACLTEAKEPAQAFINITLDFGDGVQAAIWDDCAGHLNDDGPWVVRVAGDHGSLRGCDYFAGVPGQAWIEGWNNATPEMIVRPRLRGAWTPDAFVGVIGDFLDALATGRPPTTTGEDNLKTVRLIFAARESATTGLPISLPS